ncbi:MAG: hypothetical protein HGA76_07650 [Candidatus Firestonebacteria bacterium]|nr:hypothetical protein [Candidatus Firestonebacteria bacterium]
MVLARRKFFQHLPSLCLAGGFFVLLPAGASVAEVEVGPGLRFESQQVYVRDAQGRYFQTNLQETLGTLCVRDNEGPWQAQITGAWADWNPSGDWQGSNFDQTALDTFYWERQANVSASLVYEVWAGVSVGAGYADTSVRHYRGDDQFTYLQYRTRTLEALLQYSLHPTCELAFSATAAYAPYAVLEVHVNSNVPENYPAVHALDLAGGGTRWRGSLQGIYRFPWGLGVDLVYEQGFARFSAPGPAEEVTLRFGRLSGYLVMAF